MNAAVPPDGVLGRAVLVLTAFGPEDHTLRFVDLVRRTGLPKTTTHRLLAELVELRLLEREAGGSYRLGGRLFELGMRASVERRLLEVAMPFLQDLYERSHETVHLGVREGAEVVYVSKIGGHRQAMAPSHVGGRMPLHCTAIGKVLLAHADRDLIRRVLTGGLERRTPRTITAPGLLKRQLDQVLEDGVAYEYEESTVGLVCVAAPVLDQEDRPVGAISVAGPATRFRPEQHVDAVRAAAAGVGSMLARRAELLSAEAH
jgi:DNA-binding IclR family transcriptional regulator